MFTGWDGGRQQTIHLELLGMDGTVFHNITNAAGHFLLPDIEDDRNLTALVYASSPRGRSKTRTVHLQTITPLSPSGPYNKITRSKKWKISYATSV